MRAAVIGCGVAIVAALVPADARACIAGPSLCYSAIEVTTGGTIPVDGVIPILPVPVYAGMDFLADDVLAMTTVAVTSDGVAVAGALEVVDALRMLVWRPAAPLVAGATYSASVTLDNTKGSCFDPVEQVLVLDAELMATADPLPALAVPTVMTEATAKVVPGFGLDALVCCDGAYPEELPGDCFTDVLWDEGDCAVASGTGFLDVALTLAGASVQETRGQIGYVFNGAMFPPGALAGSTAFFEPKCVPMTAINLATGETLAGPDVCMGQEFQDMLGEQPVDPTPGLQCSGMTYTCEPAASGDRWDPEKCAPWPGDGEPTTGEPGGSSGGEDSAGGTGGDGGDKGCGCASTGGSAPWGLALLLAWRRRRPVTRR